MLELATVFKARVLDIAADSITVEMTGGEEKVDRLLELLHPFGLLEVVRTGIVAMRRGAKSPSVDDESQAHRPRGRRRRFVFRVRQNLRGFSLGGFRFRGVRLGPERREKFFQRQRVDHVLFLDPAAPRGLTPYFMNCRLRVECESVEITIFTPRCFAIRRCTSCRSSRSGYALHSIATPCFAHASRTFSMS